MAGLHRKTQSEELFRIELRVPGAVKAHLADAAAENKRSLNEEIIQRAIQPATKEEIETDVYEGYHSLDVLMLRTEPEDAGARIELWRALRDVSRKWLAHQLGITTGLLKRWEMGQPMGISEDVVLDQLARVDRWHPHRARMAEERLEMVNQRNPAISKIDNELNINEEIDWLPGSYTYTPGVRIPKKETK